MLHVQMDSCNIVSKYRNQRAGQTRMHIAGWANVDAIIQLAIRLSGGIGAGYRASCGGRSGSLGFMG